MGWTDVVFTTFSFANGVTNWWWVDVSKTKLDDEYQEIYDFTEYLLTTYNNSGITFTLQGLEQDWNMNSPTYNPVAESTRRYVDNFCAWFGVRQKAVEDARKNTAHSNVTVLHALEPNRIFDAYSNPNVSRLIRDVAPRLTTDRIHYSAYDSTIDAGGWRASLADWINYYSPLFRQSLKRIKKAWPGVEIVISELGWPENELPIGFNVSTMIETIRAIAEEEGCKALIYWIVFDNEGSAPPGNRGYWLIKPGGSLSGAGIKMQALGPGT
jgi:hypothetical protein